MKERWGMIWCGSNVWTLQWLASSRSDKVCQWTPNWNTNNFFCIVMSNSWAIKNQIKASWEQYKLSKDTVRVVVVTAVFDQSNHIQEKSKVKNTRVARVSLRSRQPWTFKEHLTLYEINSIFYGNMNIGSNETRHNSSGFTRGLDSWKKCAGHEHIWKISWRTVSNDIFQFQSFLLSVSLVSSNHQLHSREDFFPFGLPNHLFSVQLTLNNTCLLHRLDSSGTFLLLTHNVSDQLWVVLCPGPIFEL